MAPEIVVIKLFPRPNRNKAGMVKAVPIELTYIRPRMFFCIHLSEKKPPIRTPKNEDIAIVIVDIGPAFVMSMERLLENNVGNQFFVAHPGILGTAKYNRIIQNVRLPKRSFIPFKGDLDLIKFRMRHIFNS